MWGAHARQIDHGAGELALPRAERDRATVRCARKRRSCVMHPSHLAGQVGKPGPESIPSHNTGPNRPLPEMHKATDSWRLDSLQARHLLVASALTQEGKGQVPTVRRLPAQLTVSILNRFELPANCLDHLWLGPQCHEQTLGHAVTVAHRPGPRPGRSVAQ